jgi:hypothetical protein
VSGILEQLAPILTDLDEVWVGFLPPETKGLPRTQRASHLLNSKRARLRVKGIDVGSATIKRRSVSQLVVASHDLTVASVTSSMTLPAVDGFELIRQWTESPGVVRVDRTGTWSVQALSGGSTEIAHGFEVTKQLYAELVRRGVPAHLDKRGNLWPPAGMEHDEWRDVTEAVAEEVVIAEKQAKSGR